MSAPYRFHGDTGEGEVVIGQEVHAHNMSDAKPEAREAGKPSTGIGGRS